nr:hypothetical protein [Tanacetum cinerariifolium]
MPTDQYDPTHRAAQRGEELAQGDGICVMTTCQRDQHRDESDDQGRSRDTHPLNTCAH